MPTDKNTEETAAPMQAPNYMDTLDMEAIKEGIAEIESYGTSRDNPYQVLNTAGSSAQGKYQFTDWWMTQGVNSYKDFADIKRKKGQTKKEYLADVKEHFITHPEEQEAYMDKIIREEYAPQVNYKKYRAITEKYGAANTIAMLHYNGADKARQYNKLVKKGKEEEFKTEGQDKGLNVSTAEYMSKFKTGVDNWYTGYMDKVKEEYYTKGTAPQKSGNIIEQQPAEYPMEFLPEMTIKPQPEEGPVVASMKNGARFKKYFAGGEEGKTPTETGNIIASNTTPNTYTYAGEEVTTANTDTVINPTDLIRTEQTMADSSTYAGPRHEIYMNQGTKGPVPMDPRDKELHAKVNARKHPLYGKGLTPADRYSNEGLAIYDDYVRNTWEPLRKVSDQGYIIDGPLGDYYQHLKSEGSNILNELNTKYPEYGGNIPPEVMEKEHPEYYQYLEMLRGFDGRIGRNFNLEGATELAKSKNGSRIKKEKKTYTDEEGIWHKDVKKYDKDGNVKRHVHKEKVNSTGTAGFSFGNYHDNPDYPGSYASKTVETPRISKKKISSEYETKTEDEFNYGVNRDKFSYYVDDKYNKKTGAYKHYYSEVDDSRKLVDAPAGSPYPYILKGTKDRSIYTDKMDKHGGGYWEHRTKNEDYTGQEELQNNYDLGGMNGKPIHDHNPDGTHPIGLNYQGSQISQGASMGQAQNYYNNMNTAAAGQQGLNAMNGTYSAQSNPFSSGGNMNFNVDSSGNMGGGYGTVWNMASPMLYEDIDENTREGYVKKQTLDLGGKGVETGNIYGALAGFVGGNIIGHANWGAESDLRTAKSQGNVYKNELAERDYWKNQDIIKGQQEYFDQHTQDPKRFSAHRQWYGAAPETNPLITNDGAKMAKGAKAEVKNDELLMDGNSVMKVSKNANDHEKSQPGREFTGEPFVYTNSGKASLLNGNDKLTTIYENPNAPAGDQMMVISDNEDLLSNVMSSEEIEELQKRIMSI
jgi:hypothetical protein